MDDQNEQPTRFAVTAEALLRAEEIVAALRERDTDRLTDLLLDAQADPNASVMALATLARAAVRDAADQRGKSEEFMLRALASWVGHVYATQEESETDG